MTTGEVGLYRFLTRVLQASTFIALDRHRSLEILDLLARLYPLS
jgi:hypothetical protein